MDKSKTEPGEAETDTEPEHVNAKRAKAASKNAANNEVLELLSLKEKAVLGLNVNINIIQNHPNTLKCFH